MPIRKTNSDWRKQLQDFLEKNGPKRRGLAAEEQQRLTKLEGILATLRRGENVQNSQLQLWLAEDE